MNMNEIKEMVPDLLKLISLYYHNWENMFCTKHIETDSWPLLAKKKRLNNLYIHKEVV